MDPGSLIKKTAGLHANIIALKLCLVMLINRKYKTVYIYMYSSMLKYNEKQRQGIVIL